ncbi:MAG TPA: hypothetical protein ENK34_05500 [Rhodobacteraceae bacterium]|nr:hypothetical protein [Paracoccaceae bacterium]
MFKISTIFKTPTLFLIGFLFQLSIGGVTFIRLSQQGQDRAYHDTYYVVGHFYYALNIGLFFILFAAVYFSVSRWSRRQYPEWAGRLHFAMLFIGSNLSFYPQYFILGQRIPRRYIDYPEAYAYWSKLSSYGLLLAEASFVLFIGIVFYTLFFGRQKVE